MFLKPKRRGNIPFLYFRRLREALAEFPRSGSLNADEAGAEVRRLIEADLLGDPGNRVTGLHQQ